MEEYEPFEDEDYIERIWLDMVLTEFAEPNDDSDLVLVVEGHRFNVHRLILKIVSPVFKAMLEGDFKERDANEIKLPGKKAEHFVQFLLQIYPKFNSIHNDCHLSVFNLEEIYKLADEYQVEKLKFACEEVLKTTEITLQNAIKVLQCCKTLKEEDVKKACFRFLSQQKVSALKDVLSELDQEDTILILEMKAIDLENCLESVHP